MGSMINDTTQTVQPSGNASYDAQIVKIVFSQLTLKFNFTYSSPNPSKSYALQCFSVGQKSLPHCRSTKVALHSWLRSFYQTLLKLRRGARNGITELSLLVIFNRGRHLYSLYSHSTFYGRIFLLVALCNRAGHYIFALWFLSSSSSFFFSSPNLSGRRLDVYHTLTHGVALVRI